MLLSYPNFSEYFLIHTDSSKTEFGWVTSQDIKPIDFWSRKLTSAQINYNTTERELLSIVKTLK